VIVAIAFALVAGVGALACAEAGRRWNPRAGFAAGTLVVNIAGSFVLGLHHGVGPPAITIIGVGGLGTFTTFSGFSADAVALAGARRLALAFAYVTATCVGGIGAAALGMAIS
jgi:fluoride exporter